MDLVHEAEPVLLGEREEAGRDFDHVETDEIRWYPWWTRKVDLPQVLALGEVLVKDRVGVWVCEEVLSPSTLSTVSRCLYG